MANSGEGRNAATAYDRLSRPRTTEIRGAMKHVWKQMICTSCPACVVGFFAVGRRVRVALCAMGARGVVHSAERLPISERATPELYHLFLAGRSSSTRPGP